MSERPFIKHCPMCGGQARLTRDNSIFSGQDYGDRYPPKVARQDHGFQIRCHCGLQTCWWHYDHEALEHWNDRIADQERAELVGGVADLIAAIKTIDGHFEGVGLGDMYMNADRVDAILAKHKGGEGEGS